MTAVLAPPNPMLSFIDRYAEDPVAFVRNEFKAEPTPGQLQLLTAYGKRHRRISKRSGHGVGKTTALAWIAIHHAICRFPQKTVITAPTSAQLWDALWAEILTWLGKLPPELRVLFEVKSERIELIEAREESFISARTSRAETPEAMAGVHAAWVLLIADEASGIPNAVFEAGSGSMSGHNAVTILTGNPVRGQGFFFDTHHKLADMWVVLHESCLESPLVSKDFIHDMQRRYGENSNAYRVRVLGEFPVADDDTVIPWELIEASLHRDVQPAKTAPMVWGVDCARFGSDRSALAKRKGNTQIGPILAFRQLDTMQLAGRVKHEWDVTPIEERPTEINVDVIGLGAGVVDRLRQLGLPVRGINVSEAPALNDGKYRNLKAELWFKMKAWFNARDTLIVKQEEFLEELAAPRYKFLPNGKMMIESKDDMKKRGALDGNRSPDLADAFVLTFASESGTLIHGARSNIPWNKPIRRNIKGIV